MSDAYLEFLKRKMAIAPSSGFEFDHDRMSQGLRPHCRAIIPWLLRGGRRALFASFGLQKTVIQLDTVRLAAEQAEGPGLIVCPLGVRQEFRRDAVERLGWSEPPVFIRSVSNLEPGRVYLTNYETVRDGKLDPKVFAAASLDEADILRGFGGSKTFREFMALFAGDAGGTGQKDGGIRYRFVATATPSPNDYIELLAYAAYLGVMDVSAAKTRFFKRDSTKADHLTIHPHKVREFWLWVASWALFVQKPSDLGREFIDDGYELPPLDVRWHEIPSDHGAAGVEKDGQARMFRNAAIGVQDASREKRQSLTTRVALVRELVHDLRGEAGLRDQVVIWCDLNDEQRAIDAELDAEGVSYSSLYGAQAVEEREPLVEDWKARRTEAFVSKPTMYGAGVNLQQCHTMIFAGIGFKAKDFLQAMHRIHRFQQVNACQIHIIYTEAERDIRQQLETKWKQHVEQGQIMAALMREYGLAQVSIACELTRALGVQRAEICGEGYTLVNNDCILETRGMQSDSVDLIVTSIPFSTQYEYSPSYNDFGHTDDNEHFWKQMDFLIPELYRVLKPGRVAAIHVKDRITPSGISGMGFQTVEPFSDQTTSRFRKHGFGFLARKSVITDVVRENNQTYRLGWSEQCKDGSRMGAGMPEYVLLFRKPPTDRSNGYADTPVVKEKSRYSRPRWQFDAHGFMRSSGNRQIQAKELEGLPQDVIFKMFRKHSFESVYDFELDVKLAEHIDKTGWLPSTFMLLQPQSWHPDVWTDITRMLTLNGAQAAKGKEMHLCPLQFDIVDRVITQFSNEGDEVYDPFGGLMTVPYRALKLKRRGRGCELSARYCADGAAYCEAAAREMSMPDLFDSIGEAA